MALFLKVLTLRLRLISVPAAMELVITAKNARAKKAPLIIEAANGLVSAEADDILMKWEQSLFLICMLMLEGYG